ncbi:hypothetical protein [Spartinivicinus ruber]|uniref:hypothetical protein n=1 Tax=Spartinivicinus ruber TaxID=2683272 RepID=UPI0013D0A7D3|nr:hypothetical protein [Spartinivicinus ruber]
MQHDLVSDENTFVLIQSNDLNLQVKGKMMGFASGHLVQGGECSEETYRLFKSLEGKYVAHIKAILYKPFHHVSEWAHVEDSLEKITEFFGYNAVAKELYDQAGIHYTTIIN